MIMFCSYCPDKVSLPFGDLLMTLPSEKNKHSNIKSFEKIMRCNKGPFFRTVRGWCSCCVDEQHPSSDDGYHGDEMKSIIILLAGSSSSVQLSTMMTSSRGNYWKHWSLLER